MNSWLQLYETNVFSIVRTSKAVVPHMAARKRGMIINIGSILGQTYVILTPESENSFAYSVYHSTGQCRSQACMHLPKRLSTLSPTRFTWNAPRLISMLYSLPPVSSSLQLPSKQSRTSLRRQRLAFILTTSRPWVRL